MLREAVYLINEQARFRTRITISFWISYRIRSGVKFPQHSTSQVLVNLFWVVSKNKPPRKQALVEISIKTVNRSTDSNRICVIQKKFTETFRNFDSLVYTDHTKIYVTFKIILCTTINDFFKVMKYDPYQLSANNESLMLYLSFMYKYIPCTFVLPQG